MHKKWIPVLIGAFYVALPNLFLHSQQTHFQSLKSHYKALSSQYDVTYWAAKADKDTIFPENFYVTNPPEDRAVFDPYYHPFPFEFLSKEDAFYQLMHQQQREQFVAALALLKEYQQYMDALLILKELPTDLKFIPLGLTGFYPFAAQEGKAGPWLLPFHAAKKHGLVVNEYVDERRSIKKSAPVAFAYLKELYEKYEDWEKVTYAYLGSPALVNRAILLSGNKQNTTWRDLIPKRYKDQRQAIATAIVLCHEDEFANPVPKVERKPSFELLTLKRDVDFRALAKFLYVNEKELRAMNPVFRSNRIPAKYNQGIFYLPSGKKVLFETKKEKIYYETDSVLAPVDNAKPIRVKPEADPFTPPANTTLLYYTIQPGDNLGLIASWYGTSITRIKAWNGIRGTNIRAGSKLKVYVPKSKKSKYEKINGMTFEQKQASIGKKVTPPKETSAPSSGKFTTYTVKSGDSLWGISQKFKGVSDADIRKWNNLPNNNIHPGQILKIKQ